MDLLYPIAGAFTGFVVGLTGVGGGALMTPILLLIFGIAPSTAVATDLWFATITKITAILIHHQKQQVEWQIVYRLWLGSLPAALVVSTMIISGILSTIAPSIFRAIIGSVILITAISLPISTLLKAKNTHVGRIQEQRYRRLQKLLTILAGLVLGVLVSLTSVGAGVLGSVALLCLYPRQLTPNKLVGTEIAHAIPLAFVAGLSYLIAGKVNGHLLCSLLLGSVPAAALGSLVATRMSHGKLQLCLMVILSICGLKLIF